MKKLNKSMIIVALLFSMGANATPLYTKCAACHGEKGEKVSLGKSLIIKDMDKDAFIAALKGYKEGTYGREMKAMMKAQVMMFSDEQMKEIANYIVKK
ncbi:MAG: c-type cytochrome [Sulfurospirillaceae bacterium]|nr:c-type cytochrome [Sulfurospirillaceae bacterium]